MLPWQQHLAGTGMKGSVYMLYQFIPWLNKWPDILWLYQISSNAINGIQDETDMFMSYEAKYPWLSLDLGVGFLYKVIFPVYQLYCIGVLEP